MLARDLLYKAADQDGDCGAHHQQRMNEKREVLKASSAALLILTASQYWEAVSAFWLDLKQLGYDLVIRTPQRAIHTSGGATSDLEPL